MARSAKNLGRGLGVMFIASVLATAAGCATQEAADGSSSQRVTNGKASLTAAYNTSDFNNVWHLEGNVGFFENTTTLVLVNVSQPGKPLVRANVEGGSGIAPFSTEVYLAELDSPNLPSLGDCIAVTSDPGGRVLTDEDLRSQKEFGAFAYISDPLSGAPKRPAWAVGSEGRPKVYGSVHECLTDPDRAWSQASPRDKLTSAFAISDLGGHVQLKGSIGSYELAASVALVNVSHVDEPLVVEKGFATSDALDVVVDLPTSVKPGDCIAVKNVGGGRGFSTDEKRAKDEFGTFLYAFTSGDGTSHPAGVTASKVFRTSAECLQDSAANKNQ